MATHPNPENARTERYGGVAGRHIQERGERWVKSRNGSASADAPHTDDPTRPDDAVSIDEVVERLSRDLAQAVNAAPGDERDELRSYASELVREDTAPGSQGRLPTKRARLSFFAVAVWLAVAGALLSFLLPAAGIVCFIMAAIAGILAIVLGPGEARPERSVDSAPRS